jgi:hypothetical protein
MKRFVVVTLAIYASALVAITGAQTGRASTSGDGQQIFRFDTFGDEQLWTDTLQMQQAIATVSPETALKVGLKVDVRALPTAVATALRRGQVDLKDPAVTVQLLSLDAVVGVIGGVGDSGALESVGITCALCHSTVDDSLTKGIGRRLDVWPNRDLNVGAIVALSPVLSEAQRAVFNGWGPGKFDPRLQAFDGTSLLTLNTSTVPVLIPPAYGLRGVPFETYTGDGPISYWNNYVGVTQMGGHGNFSDSRIGLNGLTIEQPPPDLVTPKLPALLAYQLSLRAPEPPRGSFNRGAAQRGEQLFSGQARCASCHLAPTFTDVATGSNGEPLLHAPAEIGSDPAYALRSVTGMYRTTPLRGIWQHPPYFHDGSAADLSAVVNRYDSVFSLGLTAAQKADLVEYLKSL